MTATDVVHIAVDPGKNGAVAWRHVLLGSGTPKVQNMPDSGQEQYELLKTIVGDARKQGCLVEIGLELVGQYFPSRNPAADTKRIPGVLKVREHLGRLKGYCDALGVPVRVVTPASWQRLVPSLPKGNSPNAYADRKRKIKAAMADRFPNIKVTLKNADALGILDYMGKGK